MADVGRKEKDRQREDFGQEIVEKEVHRSVE